MHQRQSLEYWQKRENTGFLEAHSVQTFMSYADTLTEKICGGNAFTPGLAKKKLNV